MRFGKGSPSYSPVKTLDRPVRAETYTMNTRDQRTCTPKLSVQVSPSLLTALAARGATEMAAAAEAAERAPLISSRRLAPAWRERAEAPRRQQARLRRRMELGREGEVVENFPVGFDWFGFIYFFPEIFKTANRVG